MQDFNDSKHDPMSASDMVGEALSRIGEIPDVSEMPGASDDEEWPLKLQVFHLARICQGIWLREHGVAGLDEAWEVFIPVAERLAVDGGWDEDTGAEMLESEWPKVKAPVGFNAVEVALGRAKKHPIIEPIAKNVRIAHRIIATAAYHLGTNNVAPFLLPQDQIADGLGCHQQSVSRRIDKLVAEGVIVPGPCVDYRKRDKGGKPLGAKDYFFNFGGATTTWRLDVEYDERQRDDDRGLMSWLDSLV